MEEMGLVELVHKVNEMVAFWYSMTALVWKYLVANEYNSIPQVYKVTNGMPVKCMPLVCALIVAYRWYVTNNLLPHI